MAYQYDIFLSSPMSAFKTEDSYQEERSTMLKVKAYLEEQKKFIVYYAGEHISSNKSFENQLESCNDFEAIENSKFFIMFYPESIVSSTLVEAGYALALKKTSIYFAYNKETLPFLLKAASYKYPHVKIMEYRSLEHVMQGIQNILA